MTVGANSVASITIDSKNADALNTLDKVRSELVSQINADKSSNVDAANGGANEIVITADYDSSSVADVTGTGLINGAVASTYLDALDISNKTANVVAEKQVVTVSFSADTPAVGDSYVISMGGTGVASLAITAGNSGSYGSAAAVQSALLSQMSSISGVTVSTSGSNGFKFEADVAGVGFGTVASQTNERVTKTNEEGEEEFVSVSKLAVSQTVVNANVVAVNQVDVVALSGAPAQGDVYTINAAGSKIAEVSIGSGNLAELDTLAKVQAKLVEIINADNSLTYTAAPASTNIELTAKVAGTANPALQQHILMF